MTKYPMRHRVFGHPITDRMTQFCPARTADWLSAVRAGQKCVRLRLLFHGVLCRAWPYCACRRMPRSRREAPPFQCDGHAAVRLGDTLMNFDMFRIARSGLAACLASRESPTIFPAVLSVMQSVRCLSGVPEPCEERSRARFRIGPLDPASPDVNASVLSKQHGGYLYGSSVFDFYRPLDWKKKMSIGEIRFWENGHYGMMRDSPGWLEPGELPRREMAGAHTFFAIFGFDDLTYELYQLLMQRIKLPEAAVFAVKDDKEAEYVGGLLCSGRVWPSHGFTVLPVRRLYYWPEGDPPKSYQLEFPTLAVPGSWLMPRIVGWGGFFNKVEPRKNFRGSMGIRPVRLSYYSEATFWRGFAAASLKKGSQWYKKMKIAAGVRAGKVVVLESRQQVLEEAEKAAEEFQGWMDPQVAVALKERDDILREHGYPDLPEEVKSWECWKDYQRGAGLNPLVFQDLQSLLNGRNGMEDG